MKICSLIKKECQLTVNWSSKEQKELDVNKQEMHGTVLGESATKNKALLQTKKRGSSVIRAY